MGLRDLTSKRIELGAILGLLAYLSAADSLPQLPLCWSRMLGLPCPTCGTTRSLRLLLHGDLAGAWASNPIGYVALVALARRAIVLAAPPRVVLRWIEAGLVDLGLLGAYLVFGMLRLTGVV